MEQKTSAEAANSTAFLEAAKNSEPSNYVFSSAETARLRIYRAAVIAGFYTED